VAPAAHRVDNLSNCVDHDLGLLLLYLMAGRRPYAAALQIHLATAADIDQAGEISALRSMRDRRV
jgi:hypothetical protein